MIDALRKIVQKVSQSSDLDSALDLLVNEVKVAMGTEVCSIYLADEIKQKHILKATVGLRESSIGQASLDYSQGLVGFVADRAEPVNLDNASAHPKFQYIVGTDEEQYSAFLGAPIIHQKKVLGVLVVQQREARNFDLSEESFLVTLSAQLAGVVAHAYASGRLTEHQAFEESILAFEGLSGSAGIGIAKAEFVFPDADLGSVPERGIGFTEVEKELVLLDQALLDVRTNIKNLKDKVANILPSEEQALFEVYLNILDDASLAGELRTEVRKGIWAQGAIKKVVNQHVKIFEQMDDPYLSERAVDVKDLGLKLLASVQKKVPRSINTEEDLILIGEEISASQILEVPQAKLKGIISVRGSSNSHMAIVARALNIPAVVGAVDLPCDRLDGRQLIVDGFSGKIFCDPNPGLLDQYQQLDQEEKELQAYLQKYESLTCETTDGYPLSLWLNIGLLMDVERSIEKGAEGVGLYRTEFSYMTRDSFPSEREQVETYRQQLASASPKPFTMRTLDIGGDKALSYFPINEENPFLGWRGIRISLDHPEILLVQIRAMMIASEGLDNLRILLPMITNVFEVDECLALCERAYKELKEEGYKISYPEIGVMIEVPAAAYHTRAIAKRVDFVSIGSNDLTQYMLAVDRNNPQVASLYNSFNPAVLNTLQYVVKHTHKAGKHVSICGELAGEPRAAVLLLAMGFDCLSMSESSLLRVKYVVRSLSKSQCQQLLKEVLRLEDADNIINHLNNRFEEFGLSHILR